ncbi:uncharacterized protein BYT42DRAFT_574806 [Radiomyces spectabilis]|uniref:uncharacterized protein n=1 Tax=Radiomyces spectabilis TaxID=64574 RepID=UPI00221F51EE|nr:uncharacterized protein BYT42DRAFT_574806 [Radiomyces spectabilis]KAI8376492.1 hypothetical protein BYT42DRAFT_574806 [Radiomyces spectabilis]
MQVSSTQRSSFALGAVLLTMLITILYLRYASYISLEDVQSDSSVVPATTKVSSTSKPTACDQVDIDWLASDRQYWDGWNPKSIFLNLDGSFITDNVHMEEDDTICIVTLLGPIPATSVGKGDGYIGPADSLVTTATSNSTKVPIAMQQHAKQTNAYFASVQFTHAGIYHLETVIEYRSYFWERPVLHQYQPIRFVSANKLIVGPPSKPRQSALPLCDLRNSSHMEGMWMDKTYYQTRYPFDFYGMFGDAQEDHAQNGRLFVPTHCRMEYISTSQAVQCLENKVVHVWDDGNIRRNLKAFSSTNRWCNENTNAQCICDDDDEDPKDELYPWTMDPNEPLVINETWHADTRFYYNTIESIITDDWKSAMGKQVGMIPAADVVMFGLGNKDIAMHMISPSAFAEAFTNLLEHAVETIYPHQLIVVRTPQYFCCNVMDSTAWNAGRSNAFSIAIRNAVNKFNERVLLWDVHRLGLEDNMCTAAGTTYTRRNTVSLENLVLWNLLCNSESL